MLKRGLLVGLAVVLFAAIFVASATEAITPFGAYDEFSFYDLSGELVVDGVRADNTSEAIALADLDRGIYLVLDERFAGYDEYEPIFREVTVISIQ